MKKLVLVLIAVLLLTFAFAANVAVAEEATVDSRAQHGEIYTFVQELCERNKSDKESARTYLKEKFTEALGDAWFVEEQQFRIDDNKYVNLVAEISKPNADGQIIIGAHYDTVFDGGKRYEGAGDNACGIAALYQTMKTFASMKLNALPYSVVFVAFDGEEEGLLGSEYYVSKMSAKAIESTRVMFNFDTIATGDNLYLMCENKPTDLAKLILSKADGIQEKPYAKGTFGNVYDLYGYGYYETVQGSDHTPFRLAGIPTAFFFSGTYSATVWSYAESTDPNKAVTNTQRDTFENLVALHPDFESRIATVSNAVVDTVLSAEILTIDTRGQLVNLNFWYNAWWPIVAIAVIGVACIVIAIFYFRKLQKNAILGESEIKTQTVFEKPSAEDIFSFGSDDSDDIFTFKK